MKTAWLEEEYQKMVIFWGARSGALLGNETWRTTFCREAFTSSVCERIISIEVR